MTAMPARLPHRLLALAILLMLAGLLWVAIAKPVLATLYRGHGAAEESLKLLAGYRQVASAHPLLAARRHELQMREASLVGLLQGSTAAHAAANLQGEVKNIIERHGGEIRSVQNVTPSVADGFEAIALRYDVSVPMSALGDLVYAIETHVPYLFIGRAEINTTDSWQADASAARNPKLTLRLDVRGYRRADKQ